MPGNIIILHKWTKKHMLYCSWDIACDTCNFYFSFWAIFCSFSPPPPAPHPNSPKNYKLSKKFKKCLEISSFYTSGPKDLIICYTVPEICCVTDATVIFYFVTIFCPFTPSPNTPKNENLKKNEKITWRYLHLTLVYQK